MDIIILSIVSPLPILFISKYVETNQSYWIILTLLAYLISGYIYYRIALDRHIAIAYSIIKVLSIIFVTLIGIILLGHQITPKLCIGIIVGIICVYLLSSR